MKMLNHIRNLYAGTGAIIFTLFVSLPILLVAAYLVGWAVKLIVWAFKLGW
jgi:hypothetical protein